MDIVKVPYREWVLVSESSSSLTFQLVDGDARLRRADAKPSSDDVAGFLYEKGQGEEETRIADLQRGVGSKLYAYGVAQYPEAEIAVFEAAE